MNYQRIYSQLIEDAKNNPKPNTYKEKHHIIPKCQGGSDEQDNLILLTARQHFLAHWLLYKIHGGYKLACAWFSVCRVGKGQEERHINSRYFELAKHIHSLEKSKNSQGQNNNFWGKTHTEETKEILRKKCGRPLSQERKDDASKRFKGVSKSEEHKKKIGRVGLICLVNIHTNECIRVPKTDLRYGSDDWVFHRKIHKEQKITCSYCGLKMNQGNINRWHKNGECLDRPHTKARKKHSNNFKYSEERRAKQSETMKRKWKEKKERE